MKANSLQERTTELSRRGQSPTFREAFRFWLKLGFVSFGGPSGQIAMMHAELVEKKKWIGEARFLHALNFCMLLPGPEAQQLAIYIGWLLHKTRGGIVAGTLFVIPSILILWALSYVYVAYGNIPWIAAIFYGLKPAVLAIVAAAVIRIGRRRSMLDTFRERRCFRAHTSVTLAGAKSLRAVDLTLVASNCARRNFARHAAHDLS